MALVIYEAFRIELRCKTRKITNLPAQEQVFLKEKRYGLDYNRLSVIIKCSKL